MYQIVPINIGTMHRVKRGELKGEVYETKSH